MIQLAFTLYDSKAKLYFSPFFYKNKEMALRTFTNMVNSPNQSDSPVATNPGDYTLFHLGQYDDNTGVFTQLHVGKESMATGNELIEEII